MILKTLTLSTLTAALLMAASPMVSTSMSTDNGGTKLAVDAYSDGGGVLMINQASDTKFDNSAMNKLVFKYGDAAKSSNTTLKNQVNVLSPGATALEKSAATTSLETAKLVINPPVNGTACDDGLSTTLGDVWSNGTCSGLYNDGVSCDDGNSMTYGDKYTSSVCAGTYATSCKVIKTALASAVDGMYAIDPDGTTGSAPFNAFCDMTTEGGGWTLILNQKNNNWFTAGNVLSLNESTPTDSGNIYSILGKVNSIATSKQYLYKNYKTASTYTYTQFTQTPSILANNGSTNLTTVTGFSVIKTTEPGLASLNGFGVVIGGTTYATYGSNTGSWWWSVGQFQTYATACPLVTNGYNYPSNCSSYQYSFWAR